MSDLLSVFIEHRRQLGMNVLAVSVAMYIIILVGASFGFVPGATYAPLWIEAAVAAVIGGIVVVGTTMAIVIVVGILAMAAAKKEIANGDGE